MNDDLLVKYLLQETTPDENRAVETWIKLAPANQRYFDHFRLIWDRSRELAATSTVDEDKAWQRFQQRVIEDRPTARGLVRTMNRGLSNWQVAAMLTGLAGIVALIYFFSRSAGTPVVLASSNTSQVDTLPDGSVITLNRHSSLSYAGAFNEQKRTVALKGEAFFSVVPNKKKPFVVEVNGITVTVTGTSFNIKTNGKQTEVIVETGTVLVSNGKETIALTPKEKAVIAHPDSTLNKEQSTDDLYRYYRDKSFVCDHTPLWKVVQVVNEAYDVDIVIESKEKAQLRWTTTLHELPLDSILDIMTKTFDLKMDRTNSRIVLK